MQKMTVDKLCVFVCQPLRKHPNNICHVMFSFLRLVLIHYHLKKTAGKHGASIKPLIPEIMLMRCLECLFPRIAAPPGGCSGLFPAQPSLLRSGAILPACCSSPKGTQPVIVDPGSTGPAGQRRPAAYRHPRPPPPQNAGEPERVKHQREGDVRPQLMSLEASTGYHPCWRAKCRGKTKMK